MPSTMHLSSIWTMMLSAVSKAESIYITLLLALPLVYHMPSLLPWNKNPRGFDLMFVSPQIQDGLGLKNEVPQKVETRNISRKLQESGRQVVVFWGSQSGTSERLATSFARECRKRYGIKAMAADLDDYDSESLSSMTQNQYAGFIVSTFGEGDPSDNAISLSEYLTQLGSCSQPSELGNLHYFAFGLGNRKYQHFNRFVDVVDGTLLAAGAHRLGTVGRADEASPTDNAWAEWKDTMFTELRKALGLEDRPLEEENIYESELILEDAPHAGPAPGAQAAQLGAPAQASAEPIEEARLISRPLETSSDARDYLHIEFSISANSALQRYRSGDHLTVWPMNPEEEVNRLAALFGWEAQKLSSIVQVKPRDHEDSDLAQTNLPSTTSRAALLRHCLDISGPIPRGLVPLLEHFAPTPAAKSYLEQVRVSNLSLTSSYWTVGKLMHLSDPKSVGAWPSSLFDHLILQLPTLQPRYFSIASSPITDPHRIAITVAIVVKKTADVEFQGLATSYLRSLSRSNSDSLESQSGTAHLRTTFALDGPNNLLSGGRAFINVRPSNFKLPTSDRSPILMMAAGSGIAPFRGFVRERVQRALAGQEIGRMVLFFGCRSKDEDLLYEDEWKHIQERLSSANKGSLFELDCAFSRAVPDNKVYVQDRLLARQQDVGKLLLEENATCYICGSVGLAGGVKQALKQVLIDGCGWPGDKSEKYMDELKQSGRLKEDVWA